MKHDKAWVHFFIGLGIVLVLLAGITIVEASGELPPSSGTVGDDLTWTLDSSGTITISGTGEFNEYSMFNEVPWYAQIEAIKKVVIKDGVTNVGPFAFFNCTNLISVSIPNSVTEIGRYAFYGCSSLSAITIPDSVTIINFCAFSGCSGLSEITIPGSVTRIETSAFGRCSKLSSLHLPDSIKYIGSAAFMESGITSITLPAGITSIEEDTFLGCRKLSSIHIPGNIEYIKRNAFVYCENLTDITFSENIPKIEAGAFIECYGLKGLHFPTLSSILSANEEQFNSESFPDSQSGYQLYIGETKITSLIIPEGVERIPGCAFKCFDFNSVKFPESLKEIGAFAFYHCPNITEITFPANIEHVGFEAFSATDSSLSFAFAVTDETKEIDLNSHWIMYPEKVNIFCHQFTAPHRWCESWSITPILYENADIIYTLSIDTSERISLVCGETKTIDYKVFPFTDDIVWSSSDPSVLSVSEGKITAHMPGTVTVTATIGNTSATAEVDCLLPVTDFNLSANELWIPASDENTELTVRSVTPEGATDAFTWGTSNTDIAVVDHNGRVTFGNPGDVTVTATSDSGISRSCILHICHNVTNINLISPVDTLHVGNEIQLVAQVSMETQYCENHLVTFSSSNEFVATVDSETGLVHAQNPGTVIISASSHSNQSASVALRIEFDLKGLEIFNLPTDLKEIEEEAFAGSSCQAVIIPRGCRSIGKRAFADCNHLLYVFIPSTVSTIAPDAFDRCGDIAFEYESNGL